MSPPTSWREVDSEVEFGPLRLLRLCSVVEGLRRVELHRLDAELATEGHELALEARKTLLGFGMLAEPLLSRRPSREEPFDAVREFVADSLGIDPSPKRPRSPVSRKT